MYSTKYNNNTRQLSVQNYKHKNVEKRVLTRKGKNNYKKKEKHTEAVQWQSFFMASIYKNVKIQCTLHYLRWCIKLIIKLNINR